MKNILLVFILSLFPLHTYSALKNDLWYSIDGEGLYFSQTPYGIDLRNDTFNNFDDIEIQTYPTSSNALTRVVGYGSFHYKIDKLRPNEKTTVYWNKFSDTSGKYLDIKSYDFSRIRIGATTEFIGEDKNINQHFEIIKVGDFPYLGYKVKLENDCKHPIDFAIRLKTPAGKWKTYSWYSLKAFQKSHLTSDGDPIKTNESISYIYAETTDGSNIVWSSPDKHEIIGLKKYPMKEWNDTDGETVIKLHCNDI